MCWYIHVLYSQVDRTILGRLLESLGYQVTFCRNGEEAVRYYTKRAGNICSIWMVRFLLSTSDAACVSLVSTLICLRSYSTENHLAYTLQCVTVFPVPLWYSQDVIQCWRASMIVGRLLANCRRTLSCIVKDKAMQGRLCLASRLTGSESE